MVCDKEVVYIKHKECICLSDDICTYIEDGVVVTFIEDGMLAEKLLSLISFLFVCRPTGKAL